LLYLGRGKLPRRCDFETVVRGSWPLSWCWVQCALRWFSRWKRATRGRWSGDIILNWVWAPKWMHQQRCGKQLC